MISVVGWTDSYISPYREENFTANRRKALIERIRKRQYNFTYNDHLMLPYCSPFYNDGTHCVLTREQWESVLDEVYKDVPRPARLLPQDAIESRPIDGVVWEKQKFYEQMKVGEFNG